MDRRCVSCGALVAAFVFLAADGHVHDFDHGPHVEPYQPGPAGAAISVGSNFNANVGATGWGIGPSPVSRDDHS